MPPKASPWSSAATPACCTKVGAEDMLNSLSFARLSISAGGAAIQPVVTAQNNLAIVTNAALIMVLLGVVVSLFPAYRLYRVRPAAALRES